jgi:hypothetical protein
MMKMFLLAITSVVILVVAVVIIVNPVRSSPEQFIISGADDVVYLSTSPSAELNDLIANVAPRFVIEYANGIKYYSLPPIPVELETLVGQVADRFVIQYANANHFYNLAYPKQLIGDNTPPLINNLTASANGLVKWSTDEYAACAINYGTQSGIYPYSISDPLYYKLHQIQLINLIPGTTYFFVVSCSDRSENTAESIEHSFKVSESIFIFVPVIQR